MKKLSRQEKEKLYIEKQIELQHMWGNFVDGQARNGWDFSNLTDEELDKNIKDVTGQLRFEKILSFFKKLFLYIIYIFIILGIVGLLIFGIKQFF